MIRNSVTLYEDDAWLVVSVLEDLIEYIDEEQETQYKLLNDYRSKLINLKRKIEDAVK